MRAHRALLGKLLLLCGLPFDMYASVLSSSRIGGGRGRPSSVLATLPMEVARECRFVVVDDVVVVVACQ